MKTQIIELDNKSYPVYIGMDIINVVNRHLPKHQTILIVTDQNVFDAHIECLKQILKDYSVHIFTLSKSPEQDKCMSRYLELLDYATLHQLGRDINVLAFGGGAVGDFAGFFASTYKRGVDFVQLPTTILAHDSSVGGKVALNHQNIKNMIGSFYQPKAVVYDLQFIKTLNKLEILSGFGEVFKHDLLNDGTLLQSLTSIDTLMNDPIQLSHVLLGAIKTKYQYVKDDVYDNLGSRQALNLGHTLGHGLEGTTPFTHGEAILLGVCFDIYLLDTNWALKLFRQFSGLGYFVIRYDFDIPEIIKAMMNDKKNKRDLIKFISMSDYGKHSDILLSEDQFKEQFQLFLKECKW